MPNVPYCDYCGKQFRYGHILTHPDRPGAIVVCGTCATMLTGDDCYELERLLLRAKQAAESTSDH